MAREAVSAQLDGEDPGVSLDLAGAHVRACAGCTAWSDAALRSHRQLRLAPAPEVPDLVAPILAAISNAAPDASAPGALRVDRRGRSVLAATNDHAARALRACRSVLACCAMLQLVATLPVLLGPAGGPVHLDHELGSWDAALAVGLLMAALRPARAWGMLPLVGAITTALFLTGAVDVLSGQTNPAGESSHLLEMIGLFFLWNVARLHRQDHYANHEHLAVV